MSRKGLDLEAIYREHHDSVWRTLWFLGIRRPGIDDATQDVFVVLARRLGDYDGQTPVRSWIGGITRKVALKHRERAAKTAVREEDRPAEGVPDPTAVDEAVAAREAAQVVEGFVQRLDPDKRAVFILSEIEGMTAPEVAEALGINTNTVYSRLRVARRHFEALVRRHRARTQGGRQWP